MNLFRSEEHVRRWSGFQDGTDEGILSLGDLMTIFSTPLHTEKLSKYYVSSISEYKPLFIDKIKKIKGRSPFWALP
jgi:hypothetical protein